ncbi:MAG: prepilin-type N-terminal cleavage/methylation domain-containing protein [Candidatus Omnitrophota bacterium]
MKRAFSLTELVVAVVIITILILIAYPIYKTAKERALDKEAILGLKRIQAAERAYKQDTLTIAQKYSDPSTCCGSPPPCYFPCSGYASNLYTINSQLQIDIPTNINWYYVLFPDTAVAVRSDGISRRWSINYSDDEEPTCTDLTGSGVKCPY